MATLLITSWLTVQKKTSIPIPKILAWSDDPSNPIGSEYIIMEHAAGVQLHQRWPTMDLSERLHCIRNIFLTLKDLAKLKFSTYGSLYLADAPLLSGLKLAEDPEFCIGPHCGTMFWDCNPGQPMWYHDIEPNQGPCKFSVVQPCGEI